MQRISPEESEDLAEFSSVWENTLHSVATPRTRVIAACRRLPREAAVTQQRACGHGAGMRPYYIQQVMTTSALNGLFGVSDGHWGGSALTIPHETLWAGDYYVCVLMDCICRDGDLSIYAPLGIGDDCGWFH